MTLIAPKPYDYMKEPDDIQFVGPFNSDMNIMMGISQLIDGRNMRCPDGFSTAQELNRALMFGQEAKLAKFCEILETENLSKIQITTPINSDNPITKLNVVLNRQITEVTLTNKNKHKEYRENKEISYYAQLAGTGPYLDTTKYNTVKDQFLYMLHNEMVMEGASNMPNLSYHDEDIRIAGDLLSQGATNGGFVTEVAESNETQM